LKAPRTATNDTGDEQKVNLVDTRDRRHRFLTQETLSVPKISGYGLTERGPLDVCLIGIGETWTWMTPYRRYLTDGVLPVEPTEANIVKKNAGRYTLINGELFRHGYTHLTLTCVSGDQCTRIMAELHEGISGSH